MKSKRDLWASQKSKLYMAKLPTFTSHQQFVDWLKVASKSEIQTYMNAWMLTRQEEKKLVYSLCQVELRSLHMPGINYLNRLYGDYYEACRKLGFINKFNHFSGWNNQIKLNRRRKIFIDSREKNLLDFKNVTTEIKALKYGDYAFSDSDWSGKVVIERKSLTDFVGTLSSGFERFKKELQRAKDDNAYLIILVEENLANSLDFRNKRLLHYKVRIPPTFIFHNVRELIQEYDNIQFLFVDSHKDARDMVENIFSFGEDIKKFDLQLLKDSKII